MSNVITHFYKLKYKKNIYVVNIIFNKLKLKKIIFSLRSVVNNVYVANIIRKIIIIS